MKEKTRQNVIEMLEFLANPFHFIAVLWVVFLMGAAAYMVIHMWSQGVRMFIVTPIILTAAVLGVSFGACELSERLRKRGRS